MWKSEVYKVLHFFCFIGFNALNLKTSFFMLYLILFFVKYSLFHLVHMGSIT